MAARDKARDELKKWDKARDVAIANYHVLEANWVRSSAAHKATEKAENVAIAKLAGAKSAHAKAEGVMLKAKLNKEKVAKDGDDRLAALKKKHIVAEKKLDSKLHAVFDALREKVKKADAAQDVLVKAAKGIWKAENAVYAKAT